MIYKLYTNHHIYIYFFFWIIYWSSVSCIPTFHNSWLGLPGRLPGRGWHGSGLAVIAGEAIHRLSHGSWIKKVWDLWTKAGTDTGKSFVPGILENKNGKLVRFSWIIMDRSGWKYLQHLATKETCHHVSSYIMDPQNKAQTLSISESNKLTHSARWLVQHCKSIQTCLQQSRKNM